MVAPAVEHLVGILLALGGALAIAVHHLLVRTGTDEGAAYDAVFTVMATNVVLLVPAVAVLYYPDYRLTATAVASFVAAGVFGTLVGRAFLYLSIDQIGASRTSPIVSAQALVASVLGVVLLDERFTLLHGLGVVLIVVGVAGVSWETTRENPDDLPLGELAIGLLFPLGSAVAYGVEPIFANFGFAEGTPAPVGLVLKTVAATLGFTLYLGWRGVLPGVEELTAANTRWFVAAGVSNTLFLLAYYLALSIAPVNIVVPIIIVNPVFVVVLSAIFMPRRLERVTWRLAALSVVVVAGVGLVTVS